MKAYHTSPSKIEKISKYGHFDDMIFFSLEPYEMSASKTITYSMELDNILKVDQLFYDHDSEEISEIIEHVARVLNVDDQEAADLLDESRQADNADDSWFIQTQQGHVARKLGYDAILTSDEQGSVLIAPMLGREKDLVEE